MVWRAVVPTLSVTPGRNPTSIARSKAARVALSTVYSCTTGLTSWAPISASSACEKSLARVAMV
ncbi:MAG: hypothetical protein A4E40_01154 [Methanoregulaceae archaeon PtaU1.Bin059]|nr:MAG: hypothetical protein A4E40_01154 [Methanoregulaceae archaeon PtaU1.Bin059]